MDTDGDRGIIYSETRLRTFGEPRRELRVVMCSLTPLIFILDSYAVQVPRQWALFTGDRTEGFGQSDKGERTGIRQASSHQPHVLSAVMCILGLDP